MSEFNYSVPSTKDIQIDSIKCQSDISDSDNDLETDNLPNSIFTSDSHSSGNSSPKISPTNLFIGTTDYEPNMNFQVGENSGLFQNLGLDSNLGLRLELYLTWDSSLLIAIKTFSRQTSLSS